MERGPGMNARRRYAVVLTALLTTAATAVLAAPASAATLCVNPGGTGGCFATVQGAVNAAANTGDVINVAAGTYNESKVLVNKSVSIQGAGPGATIIDGQNIAPAGPGLVEVQTSFGDVTLAGMTIRNAGTTSPGSRFALFEKATVPGQTYTFENLRLEGVSDGVNFDKGLYSINSLANLILRNSTVVGTGGNPIAIEQHTGPVDLDGNTVSPGTPATSGSAIAFFTYGGTNVTTPQRVRNNTVTGRGIAFTGAFQNIAGSGTYSDVQVTDNTLTGIVSGNSIGIANGDTNAGGADGVISDALVDGNSITGTGVANSRGVALTGVVTGTDVTGNNIRQTDFGFNAATNGGGGQTGTVVSGNRLLGNVTADANNSSGNAINAENNWWGCNGGPGTAGCGVATGAALDTNPHLVLGLAVAPNSVQVGNTTTATASLRTNSAGGNYAGSVFDGPSVAFATTRGSVSPASSALANGAAATTINAGNTAGTGTASGTLDSQTATAGFTVTPGPDTEVLDPFLSLADPQVQKGKKIKIKVVAGAGEPVTATAYGVVQLNKGQALGKVKAEVETGSRVTLTLEPNKSAARKRIQRALENGRKVTADITGKLADAAGNEFTRDLTARVTSG